MAAADGTGPADVDEVMQAGMRGWHDGRQEASDRTRAHPVRHRLRRRAPSRTLGTLVVLGALGVLGAACHADGDASEPLTIAEQRALVAADSAAGDSAALAALPPALHLLRLGPYLTNEHIAATDGAYCHVVDVPGAGGGLGLPAPGERRRVELPFPDSSLVVIGVVTDAGLVGLEKVEIHFYAPGFRLIDRRSFQWLSETDATHEIRWPLALNGKQENAQQPAGGPVPRAVRTVGRRVLQLDCVPEPSTPDDSTTVVLPATFDEPAGVRRP